MKRLLFLFSPLPLVALFCLATNAQLPDQVPPRPAMPQQPPKEAMENFFDSIIPKTAKAVVLGSGYGFCEGPAVDPVGNIYFSDGKKDSIHFYPYGRPVQLFTDQSTDANGMMMNAAGELLVCEGAAYRVVAINTRTGARRELTHGIDGGRFNEPNDLTIDQHGGFYFTDPNYKHRGQETVRKEDTYYWAADGTTTRVATVCKQPNGVLLSPDFKRLYLADCGDAQIYVFDVTGPGTLEQRYSFKVGGGPDGMTCDEQGNLYVCCGGRGIEVYFPGKPTLLGRLGKERGIDYASNCVFGGPDRRVLYITAADKFLGIETNARGMVPVCTRVTTP